MQLPEGMTGDAFSMTDAAVVAFLFLGGCCCCLHSFVGVMHTCALCLGLALTLLLFCRYRTRRDWKRGWKKQGGDEA